MQWIPSTLFYNSTYILKVTWHSIKKGFSINFFHFVWNWKEMSKYSIFCLGEGYLELMCHVFNILPFLFKERLKIHCEIKICISVQFIRSIVSNSLRPHELQHARPPCSSPTPGVHPNSCPPSRWCHPAISSSVVPFSSCPQFLPASVFSNESAPRIRWPKYWSFSFNISPTNEHPGLISFRMDWLDLLAVHIG